MAKQGACYRAWQFLMSLRALGRPMSELEAERLLSPAGLALFGEMARYDRAHSLRVLRHLREKGIDEPALLQAALLHDVGKSSKKERIPLLYRGPIVLSRNRPRLWAWLSRERPAGDLRYPFFLYRIHARRGAELARAAGLPEAVVTLIAAHHDEDATGLARLLQEADGKA